MKKQNNRACKKCLRIKDPSNNTANVNPNISLMRITAITAAAVMSLVINLELKAGTGVGRIEPPHPARLYQEYARIEAGQGFF